jgi:ATP-dependent Clp protease ATP-binding subunit ClpA
VRSALKFLGLLAAFALFFLLVFVKPRGDIEVFVGFWIWAMVLLALPLLVILGLGMTASEVIKEFDRRVTRLWTSRSPGTRQFSAPVANIPAEQAFDTIYGQDDAVRTVRETLGAAQRGLQTRADGPLASFLFLGPTGVGKTELAYRIGALLRRPVVKFDLGDFADKHAAFRFTGAPPSYIGSEQPGQLAQAILEHGPYVILLLDEITLAHPTIWDVLMGLLDKGSFQDGSTGRWFNLQQKVVIVMTSNALEERAEELHHLPETEIRDLLSSPAGWRTVVGHDTPFRKAFAGRITRIVPFHPLSRDAIRAIVKNRLDTALANVKRRSRIDLSYGDEAVEALAATVSEARYGVREIDSVIYDALSPALADIANEHLTWGKRGRLVIEEEGAATS